MSKSTEFLLTKPNQLLMMIPIILKPKTVSYAVAIVKPNDSSRANASD